MKQKKAKKKRYEKGMIESKELKSKSKVKENKKKNKTKLKSVSIQ